MLLACQSYAHNSRDDGVAGDNDPARGFRRAPSAEHSPAHLRRPERGSVFLALGAPDHFPAPGVGLGLRSAVRDQHGRQRHAPRVERPGPHHLRLLLARRSQDLVRQHRAHRQRVSPRPDFSLGYVWALYDYDIYAADSSGAAFQRLFATPRYDAEATLSPDGRKIVFTSLRDGDLEIYTMDVDGSNVRRLTTALGYDGGPFFSPDGKQIVYRAWHPQTSRDSADYKSLLDQNLVRPSRMEIWVMNADGSGQRRVTNLGGANFAPYFHPDGRRILFASNHKNPRSRNFDLYLVNADGSGLEQITTNNDFDAFP